jgi:hypothetical protein
MKIIILLKEVITMQRSEIFERIQKMKAIEYSKVFDIYDKGLIDYFEYKEKCNTIAGEYREWEIELMLANDNELNIKFSYIINRNLSKF